MAVGVEGGVDDVGGDGALAADAPEVAAEFDDSGRNKALCFSGIEDERDAIAELAEDFVAAGAGGRAGDVGAGAGERNAEFLDELNDDFTSGPAKSDAARVAGDLEGKTHGSVEDDGERTRPEGFGEAKEIVGELASENAGVMDGVDEDGKGPGFGAALDTKDLVDGGEIDGIGGKGVERIGGNGDDSAAIEPTSSVTDKAGIGRIRANL